MVNYEHLGRDVIDTKTQEVVHVVHIIDSPARGELFIVETDDDKFYITSGDNLIPYDKYYFEREEQ